MIETVALPELMVIGFVVEAPWTELPQAVPAAWRRLFAAPTGASNFLEASLSETGGVYRELVGYLAAAASDLPEGMERVVFPAGRYLRLRHEGPVTDIHLGFGRLLEHARAHGLAVEPLKLDFGYRSDGQDGAHELHVRLKDAVLRLA
ncbi:GyrI-like domain-containing protein [Oryzibacter oryziterrae]|uniref:GyrI-like domain-containing protein n=1 Tax=Oryzibacter oryziterrae TaxID=2766474 RepID=UPI001F320F8E|nr:GyrI-like domain-containing protein [Oryzibacter oryziterrae]